MPRGFKVKINPTDTLYSKIIRFDKERCERCQHTAALQCAHIMSRRHLSTRWMLEPVKNAVALCSACHDWFDTHVSKDILFDERLQKIKQPDNRYWFLVDKCGYTFESLVDLYRRAQCGPPWSKKLFEDEIRTNLKQKLKEMEKAR